MYLILFTLGTRAGIYEVANVFTLNYDVDFGSPESRKYGDSGQDGLEYNEAVIIIILLILNAQ
jgi:hypothetical protein